MYDDNLMTMGKGAGYADGPTDNYDDNYDDKLLTMAEGAGYTCRWAHGNYDDNYDDNDRI